METRNSERVGSVFSARSLAPFVLAARVARLEERDARERREAWLEGVPDPAREHLARRILEAGDIVQVIVVEPVVKRLPEVVEVTEIDEPTGALVDRPGDRELDLEAVPV